jgi:hypothetical protein
MAITIVATAGAADANSYLTLAAAQTIIDGLVENDDVAAWGTATTDQKNRALYTATQRLDRERYLGARATDTQSLQWPRTGVRKPDTYINTYAVGFPFRITTDYFADDEIPVQVQEAQATSAGARSAGDASGLLEQQQRWHRPVRAGGLQERQDR